MNEEMTFKVNSNSGEALATIRAPADGLTAAVIEKIVSGKEYRRFPQHFLEPMVVIDVGANAGAAIIFFKLKFPQAKIHGFEPSPDIWAYLKHNTQNFPNIDVYPFGLLAENGSANFYPGIRSTVESSFIPHAGTVSQPVEAHFRRASTVFEELSIEHISILKIDTEGAEVEILTDLQSWLPKIELIFIEFHSEEDRLAIDQLLTPFFILSDFSMDGCHRGLMTYLSKRKAREIASIERSRICRS
ncbi:MAG: FkbM family methyltransferase [Desulfobacterales bacterium]|nr:FkbM family methyltransferase [Desulfobacterales bacterium]